MIHRQKLRCEIRQTAAPMGLQPSTRFYTSPSVVSLLQLDVTSFRGSLQALNHLPVSTHSVSAFSPIAVYPLLDFYFPRSSPGWGKVKFFSCLLT